MTNPPMRLAPGRDAGADRARRWNLHLRFTLAHGWFVTRGRAALAISWGVVLRCVLVREFRLVGGRRILDLGERIVAGPRHVRRHDDRAEPRGLRLLVRAPVALPLREPA